MTLEAEAPDEIVHAVERPQHRALSAAGRPDEAGDLALLHLDLAVSHGEKVAVEDLVELAVDHHGSAFRLAVEARSASAELGSFFHRRSHRVSPPSLTRAVGPASGSGCLWSGRAARAPGRRPTPARS